MIHYTILQRDLAALRPELLNHQQYADNENNQYAVTVCVYRSLLVELTTM